MSENIELFVYDDECGDALKDFDADVYNEVTYHGDVLKDTVTVAEEDGELLGAGFLMCGPTFKHIDEKLPYYYLGLQYRVIPDERAGEVSSLLINELQGQFLEICRAHPDKRLILRHWVNAGSVLTQEIFYASMFQAQRIMNVFRAEISAMPEMELPEGIHVEIINLTEPAVMKKYSEASAAGFTIADSANELLYYVEHRNAVVYAAMDGDRIVASVTTWKIDPEIAATENVFCVPEYRRRGITSGLLSEVAGRLGRNYKYVQLNVYGDDFPAINMYQKLGYELLGNLIELHFEKHPEVVPF